MDKKQEYEKPWRVITTPTHHGDGYSWGGAAILVTPCGMAIDFGSNGHAVATRIAAHMNFADCAKPVGFECK